MIDTHTTEFDIEVLDVDENGNPLKSPEPEKKSAPQHARVRQTHHHKGRKDKKKHYGWAFFLASLFIGLGITASFGSPMGLFTGMGVGFLFFVEPIYKKVMSIFER